MIRPAALAIPLILSACTTAQLSSPTTKAAMMTGAQCIASIIDFYNMRAQIEATVDEHRLQTIDGGKAL